MSLRQDHDTDHAEAAELEAAQLAALDESGWGVRFRLFQPRNPTFWVLVIGLLAGVATLVPVVTFSASVYGTALAAGVIGFAVYTVPWWIFLHHYDRYTPLPVRFVAVGFVWGAIASTFWMAYNANNALLSLYAKWFGQAWAMDWGPGLVAPFTEELAKATGLVLLIGLGSKLVRSPYDGFVIGAFVGLGFQVAEDVLYAAQSAVHSFGANQISDAVSIIGMRGALGIVSHTLYSAIFCAGLVWFLGRPRNERNRPLGIALMAFAMFSHFVWDSMSALAGALFGKPELGLALGVTLMIVDIVAVVWVARRASNIERHWMRDLLAPEVARGTITDAEVAALAGTRQDRHRYARSAPHGRRRAHHVLEAVAELAAAIAHGHGAQTAEVAQIRDEVTELRTSPH
ncbi:PrsW family intramembrane metalloprotease [Rhodococcus sp. NPDC127528]|uniref:PrsW family intramembrane metalloprotease n=1 Tax=unclassified Rhodococcus (in: high G+C Gram-positive bacteria) TaxID=192944 RepID=UPI003635D3EF